MTSDVKQIIIITTGWFPEGDAGAVRLKMTAKALTKGGYQVKVLCRGKINDSGCVDGIKYESFRYTTGNRLSRGAEYWKFPSRVKKYLENNVDEISSVYIYNAQPCVFKYCKRYCTKFGKTLIHDCVEWYSPEEYKLKKFSYGYIIKNKINSKILDKSFRIISISSYLNDYFKAKGIKSIIVPVLCDTSKRTQPKEKNDKKLTLFYAGVPGRKDFIGNVLRGALLLTEEEQKNLKIVFVGSSRQTLIEKSDIPGNVIDACAEFLEIHGRVERSKVLEMMEQSDFVLLPRNADATYAKAGFPSKVTEALANATPILCNLSSDLEHYLTDGENALIAEDHSPEALAQTVRLALKLSPEEKNAMSRKALDSAVEKLDYNLYVHDLRSFIENR